MNGPTACSGGFDQTSFFYCPADQTVYIGNDQLWDFYAGLGDAAAVVGFAHEVGHHLQWNAGVFDLVYDQTTMIDSENQADCVAGAFFGWAVGHEITNEDDLYDVAALIEAIASAEDDPYRDHGTLDERADSLVEGLGSGLAACNAWFPLAPLITE